jgi:chemotaxis methyl-accepting protein methylase
MSLQLTDGEFSKFQRFIYDAFGIVLPEAKRDMLANRLRQMLVEQGFSSFDAYYETKLKQPTPKTLDELINRVSTNHTYFYREARHFEHLRADALPNTAAKAKARSSGRPEFRMWCAAASTGQEPYGLGIQLREHFGKEYGKWSIRRRRCRAYSSGCSKSAFAQGRDWVGSVSRAARRRVVQALQPDEQDTALQEALRHHLLSQRHDLFRQRDQAQFGCANGGGALSRGVPLRRIGREPWRQCRALEAGRAGRIS